MIDTPIWRRPKLWLTIYVWVGLIASLPISFALAQDDADEGDEKPAARSEERKLRFSSDPAVQALLATRPKTPEELLRAIDILIDLRAIDDAYVLLQQVQKAQLDDETWANLVEKFGAALFLRLALIDDLQPLGRQVSDAALSAADHRARDPARLAELIDQLSDSSAALRRGAMTRLVGGREAAIQALVAALVDPARESQLANIQAALARFGREAIAPLTAMVRSSQATAGIQAIQALAELGEPLAALDLFAPALLADSPAEVRAAAADALIKLIGRVPQADESAATLLRKARPAFDEALQEPDPEATPVLRWRWDEKQAKLDYAAVPPVVARLDRAAEWSADAARLIPRRREARWLALAAGVEADAYRAGIDQPSPPGTLELIANQDVETLDGMLAFALRTGHTVAATSAARALGTAGKPDILYLLEPQPSSLVEAARSNDRRLRFAALEAVVTLRPKRPYPGSSMVVEALGFLAGSFAAPRVISADARTAEAERQAGLLAALGYETDVATSEREVVAEAISSPDYLLALIDYSLAGPTSGQLLQRLRRDNRTARLPIGIIASSDDLEKARRLAQKTPLSAVIYRPVDTAGLEPQLERLLAQAGQRLVLPDERLRQARQALDWLVEITAAPEGIYNLRRIEGALSAAVQIAELSPPAAKVLAALGTATSQRTLIDVASQPGQPSEIRQAAAQAFAESVARFGTLLTTSEINQQYERYNQSLPQEDGSQALLASILDTIEARAAADQADE